ncbi:hypothetical protein HC752_16805 [Vibrio sp. S9_S30]|uniref:hypothetical protein n=1 Tax=Vibrio sp. S9_S30 TaxID=2720226 RepID=UPI0016818D77|nr:hypothetical protein [Vibrio sp. S9_S30]MBD1558591.1 hypothetical protein [Vibrio sp. S9_S30]
MAERFCKLNRRDISASLGDIHGLVSSPQYLCRSCARASSDKRNLCKPAAIPPASCMENATKKQTQCGLVAESLAADRKLEPAVSAADDTKILIEPAQLPLAESNALMLSEKALKKQKKSQNKLTKVLKKQKKLQKQHKKLLKKHKKLEKRFSQIHQDMLTAQTKIPQPLQVH